jgi:hypothetical protein
MPDQGASPSTRTPGPRDYSAGTRAALASLSGGTCYFPGCATPIIEFVDGEPITNYDIAHIRDARPGNRYDASMTDDQRRSFENLVLLCTVHHKVVDKVQPRRYPSAELQRWKSEREVTVKGGLRALRGVSEERLEEMLRQAVASVAPGPAPVHLDLSMGEDEFEEAVARALGDNDDITLRRFLERCERDWRRLVTDRGADAIAARNLLDRITCLAALALRWDRQVWTRSCVATLEKLYRDLLTDHGSARHDLVEPGRRLMMSIINRVLALGTVAMENHAWSLIPELVIRRPEVSDFRPGRYTNWVRHTTTAAAREKALEFTEPGGRRAEVAYLDIAVVEVGSLACVNPDAPATERFRAHLAQFDALAAVAVSGLAPGTKEVPYWPWHRAYEPDSYEPALVRLLGDRDLRSVIFPGDDRRLAESLRRLEKVDPGSSSGLGGGWPYTAPEIVDFLARNS